MVTNTNKLPHVFGIPKSQQEKDSPETRIKHTISTTISWIHIS